MGCDIVHVYKDHGISGAKGRDKRPAFDRLCRDAAKRQFDMVMAWSVDRLGRSLQDLVGFLSELHALRIDLFLHQQGLDTTTPAGKALFQMREGFHLSAWSVVSYFLRYFSSTSTEQISPDSAGPFTSFDPVGFATRCCWRRWQS